MFKIQMYEVVVSDGAWSHTYRMAACSSCGAIVKAMDKFGNQVRISAVPK